MSEFKKGSRMLVNYVRAAYKKIWEKRPKTENELLSCRLQEANWRKKANYLSVDSGSRIILSADLNYVSGFFFPDGRGCRHACVLHVREATTHGPWKAWL